MKLKIILPILILGAAIVAAVLLIVSRPTPTQVVAPPPALLVQVAVAHRELVNFTVRSQGTVAPRTQTTLVAEASGRIIDVADDFVSGGFFQKGDVLIRIDPRNYESLVTRAQANLARANTQFAREATLAGFDEASWDELRTRNPLDLTLRKPQVQEAIAEIQSAQADLIKAEGDLDRTTIRLPYDGLLVEKLVDIGQYVNVGSQLAVTYAIDVAEVRLPITQQDLEYMDVASLIRREPIPVELSADLGGTKATWQAQITRTEGVFDADSRVLYLVGTIGYPYSASPLLLMGTFVAAKITGRSGGNLFKIPRYSLQRDTLWVVDEEARISPRKVTVAGYDNEFAYVSEGLEPGERYCVTPIDNPLPGMQVRF